MTKIFIKAMKLTIPMTAGMMSHTTEVEDRILLTSKLKFILQEKICPFFNRMK